MDLSGPAVPELPAAEPDAPVPCGLLGVIVECGLADAPEPDAPLLISLDLEEVVPADEEPEEDLPEPLILPQAARAKTHAKGMIHFFMKNSLKKRKENGIFIFLLPLRCMTGAINRKILKREVPKCLYKKTWAIDFRQLLNSGEFHARWEENWKGNRNCLRDSAQAVPLLKGKEVRPLFG